KIGKFKVKLHRPIEGEIKTITLQRDCVGKWYVCFSCDNVPIKPLPKTNKVVGIDIGCEKFLATSDGQLIDNPRFLKKSFDVLKRKQQYLSRKHKGSNSRRKARKEVAKIHQKIANQRLDFHHKVALWLCRNYDTICIENLQSWNSWRNLNRSMRDVAWQQFFNILTSKVEYTGKQVIKVPPKGTSQICSSCSKEVPKDLSVRVHNCPFCGLVIDRDINSAINILRLGMSLDGSNVSVRSHTL
ncbi:MAG TPA: transposase, partial [Candidatus Ratteibacteria bacterium]|nr:transposase [Candidatus Ratteibacteria bacterium]